MRDTASRPAPARPRPARSQRDLYRERPAAARWEVGAAALPAARPPARPTRGPPPSLRPPCVPGRRGHCGHCPGGPWLGPWASWAPWARGTPRPVSGAAGRGGRGGPPTWACPECGPWGRCWGARRRWQLVIGGFLRFNLGGLGLPSPSPKGLEGGSPGGQWSRCGSLSQLSRVVVTMTADIYECLVSNPP